LGNKKQFEEQYKKQRGSLNGFQHTYGELFELLDDALDDSY